MNDKKQTLVEKESDCPRPATGSSPDNAQHEPSFPKGVDEAFVYYEE